VLGGGRIAAEIIGTVPADRVLAFSKNVSAIRFRTRLPFASSITSVTQPASGKLNFTGIGAAPAPGSFERSPTSVPRRPAAPTAQQLAEPDALAAARVVLRVRMAAVGQGGNAQADGAGGDVLAEIEPIGGSETDSRCAGR